MYFFSVFMATLQRAGCVQATLLPRATCLGEGGLERSHDELFLPCAIAETSWGMFTVRIFIVHGYGNDGLDSSCTVE
jgi:hypothetical protein